MGHMVGGEHSIQISSPQLLWFGKDSVLKILHERITNSMNEPINQWINDKGVYRTAAATSGLLISAYMDKFY